MASYEPPPGLSFRPLLLAASKAKQQARISTNRASPPQTSISLHLPTLQFSSTRTTAAFFPSSTSPSSLLPSLPPPHPQSPPNAEAGPSTLPPHFNPYSPSYTLDLNPTSSETPPVKRGRGRPPGSKNKPKIADEDRPPPAEPELYPDGTIKKKRGRPKKILSEEELAAIEQKRLDKLNGLIKLGRPPKVRGPDDPPARVRKRAKPNPQPRPQPQPQPTSSPPASSSPSSSSPPAHHTGSSSFSNLPGNNDTPALEALLLLAGRKGVFPPSSSYPPMPLPLSPSLPFSSSSQIPPPLTGIPPRTLHLPSPPPPPGPMVSGLNDGSSLLPTTSSAAANVVEELDLSGLDFAAFERVLFDVQQLGKARGGMDDDDEGMRRREPEDEGRRKSRIFSEEEERLGRLHDQPSGSGSSTNAQMTLPQMMLSSNENDPDPNSLNDNSMYNPPFYSEPYHYPPPMDQLAFDMPTFLREIQEYSRSHFGVAMEDEDGEVGVGGGEGGGGGW